MRTKQQVQAIISRLEEEYPLAECSLQYEKDYELLFATRLSAQCTDERVNKVTPALFERFPTLQSLAEAEVSEVEQYCLSASPLSSPWQRRRSPKWNSISTPAVFITERPGISLPVPKSYWRNMTARFPVPWRNW